MTIRIGAFGYGLASIFGAGTIFLAAIGNPSWKTFLGASIVVYTLSILARKI